MRLLESGAFERENQRRMRTVPQQAPSDYPTTPMYSEQPQQSQQMERVGGWLYRPGAGNIEEKIRRTMSDYASIGVGVAKYTGEALSQQFQQAEKEKATGFDYLKMGYAAPFKLGVSFATQLPKELAKAPLRLSYSMLEAENRFLSKKLGVDMTIKKEYEAPFLGEIKSYGGSYDEDIEKGMSPTTAYLNTIARATTDASIVFVGADASRAIFSQRLKVVRTGKTTRDGKVIYPEIPPEAKLRAAAKYKEVEAQFTSEKFTKVKGPDMATGNMFRSKNNPNVYYQTLPESVVKSQGIKGATTENLLWRKTAIGNGLAENDLVMLTGSRYKGMKGAVDWTREQLEKKFGRSRIIEGEFGPEIKIKSITVKIGEKGDLGYVPKETPPSVVPVAGETAKIPGWDKMTDIQKADALEGVTPTTPSPLIQEAKKYKTAEEFVKSQPVIYHGTPAKFEKFDISISEGGATWFTSSKKEIVSGEAGAVQSAGQKLNIMERYPKSDLKLATRELEDKFMTDQLIQQGYRGVKYPAETAKGYESAEWTKLWFPNEDTITKSELTDIWKEADQTIMPPKADVIPEPKEITSIMRKPLVGQGEKIAKKSQTDEVKYLQEQRGFGDEDLFALSKMFNGKVNLNELTQDELFTISEAMRGVAPPVKGLRGEDPFDLPDIGGVGSTLGLNKSFTTQVRRWAADFELEAMKRGLHYPVMSEVILPIEVGRRASESAFIRFNDYLLYKVYGKYAKPKYIEERRLIEAYRRGELDAISKNKTITEAVKADITKIAESEKVWLEKARTDPAGVISETYKGIYSPELRAEGGPSIRYKGEELQKDLTAFYKFKREGSTYPLLDDSLTTMQIYAHRFYEMKFFKPAYNHATQKVVPNLPPEAKKAIIDYLQEKTGYKDSTYKAVQKYGEALSNKTNGMVSPNFLMGSVDLVSKNMFFSALINAMAGVRNSFQVMFMTIPDMGWKYGIEGMTKALDPREWRRARQRGLLTGTGTEYGTEAVKIKSGGIKGLVGRTAELYSDTQEWAMKVVQGTGDSYGRVSATIANENRFFDNLTALNEGKITMKEFEKGIDLASYDTITQQEIRKLIAKGDKKSLDLADEIQTMMLLDRQHFPYRPGTQTRMHYGMRGREGLKFSQWIWEYTAVVSDWMKRGQWDKVVRLLGVSSLLNNTFKEAYGIDTTKWNLLGPFGGMPVGPIANLLMETGGLIKDVMYQNKAGINEDWRNITNIALLSGGIVTSPVVIPKLRAFKESIQRREAGVIPIPDPKKPFSIISSTGKHMIWVDFSDLLLKTFGFPLSSQKEMSEKINVTQLDQANRDKKTDEAVRYFVNTGDFEGMMEKIIKMEIPMPNMKSKLKSYGVDLDQRLYEGLPMDLKIKYLKWFYPE